MSVQSAVMPTEIERLREGMRFLSAAIAQFAEATGDERRLLSLVAQQTAEVIKDSCIVLLLEDDERLETGAVWDEDPVLQGSLQVTFATGLATSTAQISRSVMATGVGRFIPHFDVSAVRGVLPDDLVDLYERMGLHSTLVVPMRVRAKPVGVLAILRHRTPEPLDQFDFDLAQDLANHAGLAMANTQLVEKLREHDELRAAQAEAMRANRFLDAIVEHIPDMVFVKDAETLAFTRLNRAGEELLGTSREALLGKTDKDLFPPAEAAHFEENDRTTLAQRRMVESPAEEIHTQNGVRWLHTKKVPVLGDDGTPLYLLGISHDMTEDRLQHAALVEAKEKAEAASKELESFSYSVAHDLRAPLRGIDGFAQALADEYVDKFDAEGKRYLSRVRENAQRMAVLIDDLLALSRVTRAEVVPERVDLAVIAHATLARLLRGDSGRNVEVVIEPNLIDNGDPRWLGILFDNLLSNAWKFTSKIPRAEIAVGRQPDGAYYVRDNGAGFDPQFGHKLFGVFQRLHTEREFPGTGIGLATVARIVRHHHGRVWAESTPDQGATFYFTLNEAEAAP